MDIRQIRLLTDMEDHIIMKYRDLEFERIAGLIEKNIELADVTSVFHLKSIVGSNDKLRRIQKFIHRSNHLRIAMMRSERPYFLINLMMKEL